MSVHLSIHPTISLSACLYVCPSVCQSVCLFNCPSVYLSVRVSILYVSVYPFVHPSICLSVCQSILLCSVCLSVVGKHLQLSLISIFFFASFERKRNRAKERERRAKFLYPIFNPLFLFRRLAFSLSLSPDSLSIYLFLSCHNNLIKLVTKRDIFVATKTRIKIEGSG